MVSDAYEQMREDKNSNMAFIEIKAHDYNRCKPQVVDVTEEKTRHGDWCLLWESLRPWWYLEDMRNDLGDVTFEVCYNQESGQGRLTYFREEVLYGDFPIPVLNRESGRFDPPDLRKQPPGVLDRYRSWGVLPDCCGSSSNLVLAIGFDPAASEKSGASESALAVRGACTQCLRRYRIEYWKDRVSPEQHSDILLEHIGIFRPQRVRIEINAYQKALARERNLVDGQSKWGYIIDENFTDMKKWDPGLGVPLMSRHMERGMESMPAGTPGDYSRAVEVIRQYMRWPQAPNDMVMADWLAEMSLQDLLEEMRYNVPEYLSDPSDLPPALLEEEVSLNMQHMVPTLE